MADFAKILVFFSLIWGQVADAGQLPGTTKVYIAKIVKYFQENKGIL